MSTQLLGVIIGGIIGIFGSLFTTIIIIISSNRKRAKAIRAIAKGEIIAIKEKAERYISGKSNKVELAASTPLLSSIASELGFLSEKQVIALRCIITLDMELRKDGTIEKAQLVEQACNKALRDFF